MGHQFSEKPGSHAVLEKKKSLSRGFTNMVKGPAKMMALYDNMFKKMQVKEQRDEKI